MAEQTCQRCISCCQSLILEATPADAEREPRISSHGLRLDGHGSLPPDAWMYCLNADICAGDGMACIFLTGNRCSIYDTRPDFCRDFGPDDDRCAMHNKDKEANDD